MALKISNDWYAGCLPENIEMGKNVFVESSFSFRQFFSRREPGLILGTGASVYSASQLVVEREGLVSIGEYSLLNGAYIHCKKRIEIGSRVLIAWQAGIFDSDCFPKNARQRAVHVCKAVRDRYGRLPAFKTARVIIEDDVWLGFGVVVLPGVRIGARSVIGAKSVVTGDIPCDVLAAGNPAKVIRSLIGPPVKAQRA